MPILPIIFTLAFLLVSIPLVVAPFRRRGESVSLPESPVAEEREAATDYDSALLALRDLEFDDQLGLVAEDDYGPLRETLMAQAADALQKTEQQKEEDVAARIEAAVSAYRSQRKQPAPAVTKFCPQCGQAVDPGDRFCTACGAPLKG
jgi:hypothetical protein